jgi:hypothetical protein
MDFTIKTYKKFLEAVSSQGYTFQTFSDFLKSPANKAIILRHDVDAKKENSLEFAELEHKLGIKGSYYFRFVPESFNEGVIRKIAGMGHEIGYHYETMETNRGNVALAHIEFCNNLEKLRGIVQIETICMHGSPRSKFDNRDIWKNYDYRKLGIIGEPYYDIDFNKVAYLTDTGRRWNGEKVSIRDKVNSSFHFDFRSTKDIIRSMDQLPDKIMFTIHPQRWSDRPGPWMRELIWQGVKNRVKWLLVSKS